MVLHFIRTVSFEDAKKALSLTRELYDEIRAGRKTLTGDSDGLEVVDVKPEDRDKRQPA